MARTSTCIPETMIYIIGHHVGKVKNLYSKPTIPLQSGTFGYEYRFAPAFGRKAAAGAYGGKRSVTASRPASYRAAMVPPMRSVSARAMDRPSPVELRPVSTV